MRQLKYLVVATIVACVWPATASAKTPPAKAATGKPGAKPKPPVKAEVRASTGDFVISVRTGKDYKQLVFHSYCDPVLEEKADEQGTELPDDYEHCMGDYEEAVDEVPGSKGRLFFVQLLAEVGEDFKTRKTKSWIVDTATQKILDTDDGEYRGDYDYKRECTDETWDVPWAKVKKGKLVLYRYTGSGCMKVRERYHVIKRMRLPKVPKASKALSGKRKRK